MFKRRAESVIAAAHRIARAHQFTLDEISQHVADGAFHQIHNSKGEILFCQNSLRQAESNLQVTQPMRLDFLRSMEAAA